MYTVKPLASVATGVAKFSISTTNIQIKVRNRVDELNKGTKNKEQIFMQVRYSCNIFLLTVIMLVIVISIRHSSINRNKLDYYYQK